jgi:hypothetical protein
MTFAAIARASVMQSEMPTPLSPLPELCSAQLPPASLPQGPAQSPSTNVPLAEPFRRWLAAGAWWLVVSAALALATAATGNVAWHRLLWSPALSGFASSWIFGVGRRILPIFLGCQPLAQRGTPGVHRVSGRRRGVG